MKHLAKIIKSYVTEKTSNLQGKGQYTFVVSKDATKTEVKDAVEFLYGVAVKAVRMQIAPPKRRLVGRGRVLTKRALMKKAIVTLKDGKTIDPLKLKDSKSTKSAKADTKKSTTKKTTTK